MHFGPMSRDFPIRRSGDSSSSWAWITVSDRFCTMLHGSGMTNKLNPDNVQEQVMSSANQQGFTRRDFIKLGTVGGVALFLGRLPTADALQVHSGPTSTGWIGRDGKPKFRWDAIRKVTGQKDFAFDYRSRDLPGWPEEQGYAFMLKATDAEHRFEGVDLAALGDTLQPDELLLQKDLAAHNLEPPTSMGSRFYGKHVLLPIGETAPLLGHPVAILYYKDFARFQTAKSMLRFNRGVVKYGTYTGPKPPANYGAGRFVRIGGETPYDQPQGAPLHGGWRNGKVEGNEGA